MKSRKLHAVLSAVLTVLHFRLVTLLVVPSKVSNYPAKTIFNKGPIYNAIVIHININNAIKVPKLMVIIKDINSENSLHIQTNFSLTQKLRNVKNL